MRTRMLIPAASALSLAFAGGIAGCSDDDEETREDRLLDDLERACAKIDACYGYDSGCADYLPDSADGRIDQLCFDLATNYVNCINGSSCYEITYEGECADEAYDVYYNCD